MGLISNTGKHFPLCYHVQTISGNHQTSYPVGYWGSLPWVGRVKATELSYHWLTFGVKVKNLWVHTLNFPYFFMFQINPVAAQFHWAHNKCYQVSKNKHVWSWKKLLYSQHNKQLLSVTTMLRVPCDISTILGPKCAPVAQYKLPTNILKIQACEITKKKKKKTPKCKLTLKMEAIQVYTLKHINTNTAESWLSNINRSGMS